MFTKNPFLDPDSDFSTPKNDTYEPLIYSSRGRIGRARYLAYGALSFFLLILFGLVFDTPTNSVSSSSQSNSGVLWLIHTIVALAFVVHLVLLAKRRFNDLGRSGWLSLLLLFPIPIVGLIVSLYLSIAAGTQSANQYGLPAEENPVRVKIVACLVVLATIASLFMLMVVMLISGGLR